jgi:NAD(P)-dependent dehydrogenase (short-subunit alcohol dehydrogenase family)
VIRPYSDGCVHARLSGQWTERSRCGVPRPIDGKLIVEGRYEPQCTSSLEGRAPMTDGTKFAGKVACITGAAQGFGETFAHRFIDEGAAGVVILDLNGDGAHRVANEINGRGAGKALAVTCDVGDEASVERAVQQTSDEFGGIDILVNNAGKHLMEFNVPLTALPRPKWRTLFDVNVIGIVNCAEYFRPLLRARGGGVVVNISSIAGYRGSTPYAISKLAVRGLTVGLAEELAPDGIRVCSLTPGLMASPQALLELPVELIDEFVNENQLIKRQGEMTDLVGALFFFCSDDAKFITGDTLMVTGGHPLQI